MMSKGVNSGLPDPIKNRYGLKVYIPNEEVTGSTPIHPTPKGVGILGGISSYKPKV